MEESRHHIIHTIQLSKGDGQLPRDFLPESRALTANINDATMDYMVILIFDCFVNLHIDTIVYEKLMHCIINIFDIEDDQIRILNLINYKSFERLNKNLIITIKQSSLNLIHKIELFQLYQHVDYN